MGVTAAQAPVLQIRRSPAATVPVRVMLMVLADVMLVGYNFFLLLLMISTPY